MEDRKPVWSRFGTVVTGKMSASEVLKEANLADWNVRLSQLHIMVDGEPQAIPERFATVFDNPSTGKVDTLGLVSDHYEVFQNEQLADIIDTVTDVSGAHYETAGYFNNGRRVFVNMRLPEGFTVGGKSTEEHTVYLVGTNRHDGGGAMKFVTTPVRVWCQNTLATALKQFETQFSVSHKGDTSVKIQEVRDALEIQHQAIEEFQVTAERMIDAAFSESEFWKLTEKLWAPSETNTAKVRRDKLAWLWNDAETNTVLPDSRYKALQVINEYTDHHDAPNGKDLNRAARATDGAGATRKEQAYKLLAV